MRGIAVRAELMAEWKSRGVKEEPEYNILTDEISKAAFGMTSSEYKELVIVHQHLIFVRLSLVA